MQIRFWAIEFIIREGIPNRESPLFSALRIHHGQIKGKETGQVDCLSGFKRSLFNVVDEILIFPVYHRLHGCD